MPVIERLKALEILDSRGRPTVRTTCTLQGSAHPALRSAAASVPSGASTGAAEALELRDRDPGRYGGLGCRKAVEHVNGTIQGALAGRDFSNQAALDQALVQLDGTPNKSRLGANAILSVSLAFARATARLNDLPLYEHLASLVAPHPLQLPRPTINLFSGGKHAGGQVAIQDVLVVPLAARTMDECLEHTCRV